MLVGGAFVAVNSDALMHHVTVAIQALAQGFHHQLLEVTAEHLQTIAVGQNNHVALTATTTGHEPGSGHQGGWIAAQIRGAGGGIHLRGAGEEIADVTANQGTGQQTNGTGDAGAPPHPIEHVEALEPTFLLGLLIQLAVEHRHGNGLAGPLAPSGLEAVASLLHAEMGFGRPPRLAHRHHQGAVETTLQPRQNVAHPIGIDVVEEMKRKPLARILQSLDHQGRSQTTAADADPEHIGEGFAVGGLDRSVDHIAPKGCDQINFPGDVLLKL